MAAAETVASGRELIIMMPRRTIPMLRRSEAGDLVPLRFLPLALADVDEASPVDPLAVMRLEWDRDEELRIMVRFLLPSSLEVVSVSMDRYMDAAGEDSRVESCVRLFLVVVATGCSAVLSRLSWSDSCSVRFSRRS